MTFTTIIANIFSLALIVAVIWWFFGSKIKPAVAKINSVNKVLVKDGIYQPSSIQVPANREVKLSFLREDDTACAATLVFNDLDIAVQLPLNKSVEIVIPPQKAGEINFTCQMGMYRGKLIVV